VTVNNVTWEFCRSQNIANEQEFRTGKRCWPASCDLGDVNKRDGDCKQHVLSVAVRYNS